MCAERVGRVMFVMTSCPFRAPASRRIRGGTRLMAAHMTEDDQRAPFRSPAVDRYRPRRRVVDRRSAAPSGEGRKPEPMPVPVPQQRAVPAAETNHGADLTLLVIEDDPAGTFAVPDLSSTTGARVRVRTARNLTEAGRLLTDDVDCILLDLDLEAAALPAGVRADSPDDGAATRTSSPPSSTSCGSRRATPSSPSPRRTTPSGPPRPYGSGPRTTSSAASSTDASSAAPSGTPWSASAPTSPSTS